MSCDPGRDADGAAKPGPPQCRNPAYRRLDGDRGISLIESSIALMLMAMIVAWVASSIGSTGRAIGEAHSQEQATQLALEGIEFARSLTWAELRMDPAAETGDPRVNGETRTLVGTLFDVETNESLVEGGESAMIPPSYQETLDATDFTVRMYVTEADQALRRVIVDVTWTVGDSPRRHFASTMISELSAG